LHDLDSLHQQASTRYLQGDVRAALEAWQQVLQLVPDDGRAIEGVRLCHEALEPAGRATEPDPPDVDLDPADDFPELDAKLDLGRPPAAAAGGTDTTPSPATPEDRPGLDLSWALETDEDGAEAPAAPARGVSAACSWGFSEGEAAADSRPEPRPLPPPTPVASTPTDDRESGHAAAMQLRRRANELLANALVAIEAGNHDEGLRTLDRLLILDEGNEAARALKQKIAGELDPEAAIPLPPAAPNAAAAGEIDREGPPSAQSQAAAAGMAPARLPVTERPQAAATRDRGLADGIEAPEIEDEPEVAASPPPRAAALKPTRLRLRLDRRRLGLGALIAIGLAGGVYLLSGSGSSAQRADAQVAAAAAARARVDATQKPVEGATASHPEADSRPAAAADARSEASDPPDTASRLELARRRFEAGDWAGAVVAYNDVIQLDPANAEALARLREAGENYTQEREVEQRWRAAHEAFDNKDFREALRLSYRLPSAEQLARLERFRFSGWYNLGVEALKLGSCQEARGHFDEAKLIRDGDPALAQAMRLAASCRGDADYRQLVSALSLRGLDD